MNTDGCAHDRFHENSRQETVCVDCDMSWEEAIQEWLATPIETTRMRAQKH